MKKIRSLKFILILIFVMCISPKNVNAAQIQRVFSGNSAQWQTQQGYYYGAPDVHNGMPSGYLIDDVWSHYFPSNGNYFTIRPIDTNNGLIYSVKQVCLFSDVAVNNGKVYTIDLNFATGSYMKIGSWDTTLYGFEPDSSCASNKGACSMVWNGATAKITFVPNQNSSNYYICVGSYTNQDRAIAFNNSTRYEQGIEIRSSTITHDDSSVDLSPIVNQQITTNNKIDQTNEKLDAVNDNLNDINDSINDSDTTQSQNTIGNFFNNFSTTDNGGLSDILTAPLRLLNNLLSVQNSCQPLTFPLPIVHNQVTLPCFSTIVFEHFEGFYNVYNIIISGLICYYIIRNLFLKINDLKSPDNDKLEVYDL